jgi:ABC-2 type transport system ATP-binding protein
MADNLVVIGKGKLISSGTMQDFLDSASGKGVFVRSLKLAALEKALTPKFKVTNRDGGLIVQGAKTDDVGKLAFELKAPLLELSNHTASLEEAFLEITADSQEYKARGEKGGKK